mmetsp:Transcript_19494/g.33336  ORF Transcript_19494/g.33336 Transcript_19494/m.33336 type:complete len:82 (+) Transcript_19494:706-951(+)
MTFHMMMFFLVAAVGAGPLPTIMYDMHINFFPYLAPVKERRESYLSSRKNRSRKNRSQKQNMLARILLCCSFIHGDATVVQ